jgi:N-acetylmuramoyl-L-alanine amidase CwlA
MKKYRIPPENVLRHWDVVSKVCPEPWVRDEAGWLDFQKRLREEDTVEDEKTPDAWAKEAAEWAVRAGLMEDGNWRAPLTREAAAVILYRYAKK